MPPRGEAEAIPFLRTAPVAGQLLLFSECRLRAGAPSSVSAVLTGVKARRPAATLPGFGLDPGSAQASRPSPPAEVVGGQHWSCP